MFVISAIIYLLVAAIVFFISLFEGPENDKITVKVLSALCWPLIVAALLIAHLSFFPQPSSKARDIEARLVKANSRALSGPETRYLIED